MLLAIDTATMVTGISLDDGRTVLSERVFHSERRQTAELAPTVAQMMRTAGVAADELTAVAVAQGPGSYTGLRIGMALAKGIALAHDLPLVGIPTLDILAAAQPRREEPLLAVLRAGRGRVAAVWYKWGPQGWRADSDPQAMTWDEALDRLQEPTYVCGEISSGAKQLEAHKLVILADAAYCVRRPSILAQLARGVLAEGDAGDPRELTPIYLGDIEGDTA